MTNIKNKKFKCPFCGFVCWKKRLEGSHYPLQLVEMSSEGNCSIKHIFFAWDSRNPLGSLFQRHFYDVLGYLLENRFVDANVIKELAELYLSKAPDVFRPDVVFDPEVVYEPDVIFNPKVIK